MSFSFVGLPMLASLSPLLVLCFVSLFSSWGSVFSSGASIFFSPFSCASSSTAFSAKFTASGFRFLRFLHAGSLLYSLFRFLVRFAI